MLSDKAYLALTGAVSALVVVLMWVAAVPWWIGVLVCLPIIVGGLVMKRHYENKRVPELPPPVTYQPPPVAPPPPPPASTSIHGLALPSAHRDYRFLLHGTVVWQQTGASTHPRPAQLAIDAIRERAAKITLAESPADSDLLAPRLATDLSFPRADRTGALEVWAQDTILTIPDDDRQRLYQIAEVRKNEEVWEYQRAYERNKRAYLRDDVLTSTGSAVVWWLAQDEKRVPETVDLIGTLARLVAAAQNREVEPVFRELLRDLSDLSDVSEVDGAPATESDVLGALMSQLGPTASEPERADLADRLARIAEEAGADDLARTIRDRFNAPDFTEPEASWFDSPEPLFELSTEPDAPETPVHPNGQAEPDTAVRPPVERPDSPL
jgi:hypothetical protein